MSSLTRDKIFNKQNEFSVKKYNTIAENEGSVYLATEIVVDALINDFDTVTHEYGRFQFTYIINRTNKTALLPQLLEVLDMSFNAWRPYADFMNRTDNIRATYGISCFMLNYPDYSLAVPIGVKHEHCALFIKRDEKRRYKTVVFNPIPYMTQNLFERFLNNFGGQAKRYTEPDYDSNINISSYTWRDIYNFMVFNDNPLDAPHAFGVVDFTRKKYNLDFKC